MTPRRNIRSRTAVVLVAVAIAAFGLTACNPLGPGLGSRLPGSDPVAGLAPVACVKIPMQQAENCEYQKLWSATATELRSGDPQRVRASILASAGPVATDLRVLNWIRPGTALDTACVARNLHGFLTDVSQIAPAKVVVDRLLPTALEFVRHQLPTDAYTQFMVANAPKVLSAALVFGQQLRVVVLSLTLNGCRSAAGGTTP